MVDDIDRLSTGEIRDIFKLVRLTASFPNIIYILAFDRERVENALTEQGIEGRDYLEKILQLAIDLPAVSDDVLTRHVLTAVNDAVGEADDQGPFDEQRWPDVFMEVIRPLFRSMPDVRRYSVAVYGTVRALKGRIALVDVLALEAVRIFLPDTFKRIGCSVDALTTTSSLMYRGQDPQELKEAIDDLLDVAADRKTLLRSLLVRVFPAAGRHMQGGTHYGPDSEAGWLRDRRVAHKDVLRLYLERVAGPAPARAHRPGHHLDLPAGHRPERDHRRRPLAPPADPTPRMRRHVRSCSRGSPTVRRRSLGPRQSARSRCLG